MKKPLHTLSLPAGLYWHKSALFFAGEATVGDAITGTVFGALESGARAAREVMRKEMARLVKPGR